MKQELLEYMKTPKTTDARNRMGCSENWYDPFYAISQSFTQKEIEDMTDQEVDRLIKLASNIAEGLY